MITSIQNQKVQLVRSLVAKSHSRNISQSFVVEGVRLVEEAQASGWPVQLALYSENLSDRGRAVLQNLSASGADVEEIAPHVMDSLSKTETSQGLIAIITRQTIPLPEDADLIVIVDGIRDPGNLGTLLRSSAAAGANGVLLAPGSVDAFSPKVLRAAMGAHFRMPVNPLDWPNIRTQVKERSRPLFTYLADSSKGQSCWEADLVRPCALIIGSEAEGASLFALQLCDAYVHISMPGGTESLNAAVAGSILLFEAVRQRKTEE